MHSDLQSNLSLDSSPRIGSAALWLDFQLDAAVTIEPDLRVSLCTADGALIAHNSLRHGLDAIWLPRGRYRLGLRFPNGALNSAARIHVGLWARCGGAASIACETVFAIADLQHDDRAAEIDGSATLLAQPGTPALEQLSWKKGAADWFFKHFDHAARTIGSYLLKDSPLLRGRVLDVGCGDGITDLGLMLHFEPELLIGIDPFRGFDGLPRMLAENHVPADAVAPNLRFLPASANHLPFPDDSFDVVVSWGSLEHIAGGYRQALREIKRVLRPDGLFFVHPGLYYSNYGHHLGEFSGEPFFHLSKTEDEIRQIVFSNPPAYIDRGGTFSPPEHYWQWFKELNPITISAIEQELRAHDFEPWRAAIRTEALIEYTPALLRFPLQDLASLELYLSCWNRKLAPPKELVRRTAEEWLGMQTPP